jgi:hypothetical protein
MRYRTGPRFVLAGGVAVALALTGRAGAQPESPNSNVAAEALFEDARSLAAAGKYAEACPKFADSQRLGPSVSTLLNLANCWEKLGRTATAWATYREAASAANAAGRKDYLATALRRADGLAPKLARLTVTIAPPAAPGLQVKRDGVAVDSAEWGTGIPVDPGPHAVEASAPGRKTWTVSVDVAQDGVQASVTVPVLDEAPAEAPPASPAGAATPAATPVSLAGAPPSPDTTAPNTGNAQRIVGAVLAGAGVVGLGVGGLLALGAKNKYDDSLGHCETSNPNLCSPEGLQQRNDARSEGNVATVFVGAGGALLVAGAITWFTAPHGSRPATAFQVLPTLGGVMARGAW